MMLHSLQATGGMFTQQAFCSITQVTYDLSGGLLPIYQPHRFTCIDMSEAVVLGGDGLCKLLTCFVVLWERIDVGVPGCGEIRMKHDTLLCWLCSIESKDTTSVSTQKFRLDLKR